MEEEKNHDFLVQILDFNDVKLPLQQLECFRTKSHLKMHNCKIVPWGHFVVKISQGKNLPE